MALICKQNVGIQTTKDSSPRLVFGNYAKDIQTYEKYGYSYKDHITNIIDTMIQGDNTRFAKHQISRYDTNIKSLQNSLELDIDISPDRLPMNTHDKGGMNKHSDNRTLSDFNYPDKKIGFMNLEATGFSFIGPDREPTKIDRLLKIVDIILSTGLPNYQMARIPVESGLNIQA